ncbi:MAG: hypothetical protein ACREF3_14365, partial [Acetobacteraceae bacterium]
MAGLLPQWISLILLADPRTPGAHPTIASFRYASQARGNQFRHFSARRHGAAMILYVAISLRNRSMWCQNLLRIFGDRRRRQAERIIP